jgi:hypothetical protein
VFGTADALLHGVTALHDIYTEVLMRTRLFATACLSLIAPAALFAVAPSPLGSSEMHQLPVPSRVGASNGGFSQAPMMAGDRDRRDDDCGRGNAWGCRRNRDEASDRRDERYDRRDDRRDEYRREEYRRDEYRRDDYRRDEYRRDAYRRQEQARDEYRREAYRRHEYEERYARRYSRPDYGYYRSYSAYDAYPTACIRAGGRILGAVLTVCVP